MRDKIVNNIVDGEKAMLIVIEGVKFTSIKDILSANNNIFNTSGPVYGGSFEMGRGEFIARSWKMTDSNYIGSDTFVMTNAFDINEGMKGILCHDCRKKVETLERLTGDTFEKGAKQ